MRRAELGRVLAKQFPAVQGGIRDLVGAQEFCKGWGIVLRPKFQRGFFFLFLSGERDKTDAVIWRLVCQRDDIPMLFEKGAGDDERQGPGQCVRVPILYQIAQIGGQVRVPRDIENQVV